MAKIRLHLPDYGKQSLLRLKINKSFKTVSEISRRTIEVSKVFGLGIDEEKVFHVFKDFVIEINPGDVVYITGESGAGKSVLLKELAQQLSQNEEFGGVITDQEIAASINPDEILVHGVGNDVKEALEILNSVGLNDAFLYLRRYKELSDGQKYRYRLAKAFWSGKKTLIFDEFCATLDRITARVVAYLVQKFCRRRGLTLIVATTHEDLIEDLNPDILIIKKFGAHADIKLLNPQQKPCSILEKVRILEGNMKDYWHLAYLHYRGEKIAGVRKVFKAIIDTPLGEELAGVIVYNASYINLSARYVAIPKLLELRRKLDMDSFIRLINENFIRIGRLVVHPKYRGIGLGVKLVKETMQMCRYPFVEVLAVMVNYNPVFEKAGMRRIEYRSKFHEEVVPAFLQELMAFGFDPDMISSKRYCLTILKSLSRRDRREIAELIMKYSIIRPGFAIRSVYNKLKEGRYGLEDLAAAIASIKTKPAYLLWRNPDIPSSIDNL